MFLIRGGDFHRLFGGVAKPKLQRGIKLVEALIVRRIFEVVRPHAEFNVETVTKRDFQAFRHVDKSATRRGHFFAVSGRLVAADYRVVARVLRALAQRFRQSFYYRVVGNKDKTAASAPYPVKYRIHEVVREVARHADVDFRVVKPRFEVHSHQLVAERIDGCFSVCRLSADKKRHVRRRVKRGEVAVKLGYYFGVVLAALASLRYIRGVVRVQLVESAQRTHGATLRLLHRDVVQHNQLQSLVKARRRLVGHSRQPARKRLVAVHSRERGKPPDKHAERAECKHTRVIEREPFLVATVLFAFFQPLYKSAHAEFEKRAEIGHRVSEIKSADKVAQLKMFLSLLKLIGAHAFVQLQPDVAPTNILYRPAEICLIGKAVAVPKRNPRVLQCERNQPRTPGARAFGFVLFIQFNQSRAQSVSVQSARNVCLSLVFVHKYLGYKQNFPAIIISCKEAYMQYTIRYFLYFSVL